MKNDVLRYIFLLQESREKYCLVGLFVCFPSLIAFFHQNTHLTDVILLVKSVTFYEWKKESDVFLKKTKKKSFFFHVMILFTKPFQRGKFDQERRK